MHVAAGRSDVGPAIRNPVAFDIKRRATRRRATGARPGRVGAAFAAVTLALAAPVLAARAASTDTGGPSGRGGALLPPGYLSTLGNQIVDTNGHPVRIAAVGWSGTDSLTFCPYGLWQSNLQNNMDAIKADGFNAIRIPWTDLLLTASPLEISSYAAINFSLNPKLYGLNSMQVLDALVSAAGKEGLKVILDHHNNQGGPGGWGGQQANGLWFDAGPGSDGTDGSGTRGTVTAAKFQADWVALARRYAGNSTVIGFDLHNEPTSAGKINWGKGGPTDIHLMYTVVGTAIQRVDPGALIIVEGPEEWSGPAPGMPAGFAEGDLSGAARLPVKLPIANKVVYSVHEYPPDLSGNGSYTPAKQIAAMNAGWGYLETNNIAPVWVGEFGSNMTSTQDRAWVLMLLDYMNGKDAAAGGPSFDSGQQPVGGSWWQWGTAAGQDPDGVETAWSGGQFQPAQQAATDQLLYKPSGN
jgi:aryl-phospho-beta-D-glucosidase BglC (GH1 family)